MLKKPLFVQKSKNAKLKKPIFLSGKIFIFQIAYLLNVILKEIGKADNSRRLYYEDFFFCEHYDERRKKKDFFSFVIA